VSEVSRNKNTAAQPTQTSTDPCRIRLDAPHGKQSDGHICHVDSADEEVVLNCGLDHCWDDGGQDMPMPLTNRIIVSSLAAKRLAMFFKRGTLKLPEE